MDKLNKIKTYKITVWILVVIATVLAWLLFKELYYSIEFSILLLLLGYSLTQRNLNIYKTDSVNEIVVFAGLYDHYIEVNGKRVDEYKSGFYFTPIKMSYSISENEKIEVEISLTNRIKTKINGQLVFPDIKV